MWKRIRPSSRSSIRRKRTSRRWGTCRRMILYRPTKRSHSVVNAKSMRIARPRPGAALVEGAFQAARASTEARSSMTFARTITSAWVAAALKRFSSVLSLTCAPNHVRRTMTAPVTSAVHLAGAVRRLFVTAGKILATSASQNTNALVIIAKKMKSPWTGARMPRRWKMQNQPWPI